jgi:hypothetical protein
MARPSKCEGISDMVIERELRIYSEKGISIDVEYDNMTCHQWPSSNSESNKDMATYPTTGAATPNIAYNSTCLELLQLFLVYFIPTILVHDSSGYGH